MSSDHTSTVTLERHEVISDKPFDDGRWSVGRQRPGLSHR
jgi:hypothetical protein